MHARWNRTQGSPVRDDFIALFANEIGYIKVKNFVADPERQEVLKAILRRGLQAYDFAFDSGHVPAASHLFEVHYLYEQKDPAEYFPRARASQAKYRQLCRETGCDPAKAVFELVGGAMRTPVRIASQEGEEYNHIIARELAAGSLLHTDFGPSIPARWSITSVIAQYAWNIYLTDPLEGGECVVHNRFWRPEDDAHLIPGSYAHDECVVAGAESAVIPVQPGDMLLFNCRNYHQVRRSTASRIAVGGHIGLLPDHTLIAWG